METNNTTENNKLIAEFMGLPLDDKYPNYLSHWVKRYDLEWGALMPVVEKINLLGDYDYSITIMTMDCTIMDKQGKIIAACECENIVDELIKSVYKAVVEFINWYNATK